MSLSIMKGPRHQLMAEDDQSATSTPLFADIMTLLLVFFIFLFTVASMEENYFQQVTQSFNNTLGGEHRAPVEIAVEKQHKAGISLGSSPQVVESQDNGVSPAYQALATELELAASRTQQIANSIDEQGISVSVLGANKIMIQIDGSALFASGSTEIDYDMYPVLDYLVTVAERNPDFKVNIQGHTDNQPLRQGHKFESNWELSAMRATSVLKFFVHYGVTPDRLTATGYGESMPLASNATAEGRARNRRIEIVLEKAI